MAVQGMFMRVNQPAINYLSVPKLNNGGRKQFSVRASNGNPEADEGKVMFNKGKDGWKVDFSGEKPVTPLLDTVNYPVHMKNLSAKDLEQLAAELRAEILYSVAKTGGHLSSSLGVVDLTVALHHVFNTPDDKIIWDVGHQEWRLMEIHLIWRSGGLWKTRKELIG